MRLVWRTFKAPPVNANGAPRVRRWTIALLALVLIFDFTRLPSSWEYSVGGLYRVIADPAQYVLVPECADFVLFDESGETLVYPGDDAELDARRVLSRTGNLMVIRYNAAAFVVCAAQEHQVGFWAPMWTERKVTIDRTLVLQPQGAPAPADASFPDRYDQAVLAYVSETDPERWLAGPQPSNLGFWARDHAGYRVARLSADDVREVIAGGGWTERRVHWWGAAHSVLAGVGLLALLWLMSLELWLGAMYVRERWRPAPWECAHCRYDLRGGPAEDGVCPECGRAVERP